MAYETLKISTSDRCQFIDITDRVQSLVSGSGIKDGVCVVFVPHTTAGVTINENADPNVVRDLKTVLEKLIPWSHASYRHAEGNSAAHAKASVMGPSLTLIISEGVLQLGTWQSIYFCEFDGPRTRNVWVKIY
jgi:secondary thiamine-phosphate synthase enzyme